MEIIYLLVLMHTSMEDHHLIKELRDGGHSFEEDELTGGSIFLRT